MTARSEAAKIQLECWLRAELSKTRFKDVEPLLRAALALPQEEESEVCRGCQGRGHTTKGATLLKHGPCGGTGRLPAPPRRSLPRGATWSMTTRTVPTSTSTGRRARASATRRSQRGIMISYRDMLFCNTPCDNFNCPRMLTPKVIKAAKLWWGSNTAPISVSDLHDNCGIYIKPKKKVK
jgi:hypothetical protein